MIQQVARFANGLCKLSERYAPSSNAYTSLVADEFTAAHPRIDESALV